MQKPKKFNWKRAFLAGGIMVGAGLAGAVAGDLIVGENIITNYEICTDDIPHVTIYSFWPEWLNPNENFEKYDVCLYHTAVSTDRGALWGSADPIEDSTKEFVKVEMMGKTGGDVEEWTYDEIITYANEHTPRKGALESIDWSTAWQGAGFAIAGAGLPAMYASRNIIKDKEEPAKEEQEEEDDRYY